VSQSCRTAVDTAAGVAELSTLLLLLLLILLLLLLLQLLLLLLEFNKQILINRQILIFN
jgi:hypothetical protein